LGYAVVGVDEGLEFFVRPVGWQAVGSHKCGVCLMIISG
jgi:hypothetical protein